MSCRCKTVGFAVSVLVHGLLIAAVSERMSLDSTPTVSNVPVTMDMFAYVSAAESTAEPVSEIVTPPEPVVPPPVKTEDVKPVPEIKEPEKPVVKKKEIKPIESSKPEPEPKPKPAKPQPVEQVSKAPVLPEQTNIETAALSATSQQAVIQTGEIDRIRHQYTQALLAAIEANKFYPKRARRKRHEGTVMITFVINRDGVISSIQLQEGSGFASLDKAALSVLQRIGHFNPLPVELGLSQWEFVVPISYRLL